MSRWRRPARRQAQPATYLEETLTRIAQLDPDIGAFVIVNREGARRAADDFGEALARRQAAVADRRHADRDQGHHRDRRHADRPGLAAVGGHGDAARLGQRRMRCARPAPSSSARPPPPNSRPAIRGTRPATRMTRAHAGRLEQRLGRRGRRRHGAGRRSAPRWSARSCGRRASAARRLQAERRRASTAAARTTTSARAARASIGATLADAWAVVRAIADRAGGDPGYRRADRRRRTSASAPSR